MRKYRVTLPCRLNGVDYGIGDIVDGEAISDAAMTVLAAPRGGYLEPYSGDAPETEKEETPHDEEPAEHRSTEPGDTEPGDTGPGDERLDDGLSGDDGDTGGDTGASGASGTGDGAAGASAGTGTGAGSGSERPVQPRSGQRR